MRKALLIPAMIAVICTAAASYALTGSFWDRAALTVDARMRADHEDFDDLPFGKDDWTYMAALEYREGEVYWQLGLDYGPELSSTSIVDSAAYALTPQLHLYWVDTPFWLGAGIAKTYVGQSSDAFWTGFYWQIGAGLLYPVGNNFELRAAMYYIFDDWKDLGNFEGRQMEYGFGFSYRF